MGLREALESWLPGALSAEAARIERLELLPGGAIQENHSLDVVVEGGPYEGRHALVLRTTTDAGVPVSLSREQEYAVLEVAHRAGVLAPEPIAFCRDAQVIGRPFQLMRRLSGIASGRVLVRDPGIERWGPEVARELGAELARLHKATPPIAGLEFLEVPEDPARFRIAHYRGHLDVLGEPQPVLEWGLRWLERNAPEPQGVVLCHGDFRTGNYLVDDGRLAGILDWEFAAFSDPLEDLGWFCARCWRFGAWDREAGGIAPREALYRGYEGESGRRIARDLVPWWEIMATIRWAVIALQQAERHLSGREPSLELALTGHIVPELELDILQQVEVLAGPGGP